MIVYFSGEQFSGVEDIVRSRLFSYYYHGQAGLSAEMQEGFTKYDNLFLDSGAYSALTRNTTIDCDAFIEFVLAHQQHFNVVASLDVIGDDAASWANFEKMRDAGCDVMPTIHFGEDMKYLEMMVEQAPYIGIGGVAQLRHVPKIRAWMDTLWPVICDADGVPKVKVHGFAVTAIDLLKAYPWTSVDSTSWLFTGAMGSVNIFIDGRLQTVVMSEDSPDARKMSGRHYIHLSSLEQCAVAEQIEAAGTTVEECQTDYAARNKVNAAFFHVLETLAPQTFKPTTRGLF